MRKKLTFFLCAFPILFLSLSSCSNDNGNDTNEYYNWETRNTEFFSNIRSLALDSIYQAKTLYGTNWKKHCNWRTFLSYSMDSTITNEYTDSIYVQVIHAGTGMGCPLSTDSCRIYYRGTLIPTESYPQGYVFSHSGQSSNYDKVFDHKTAVPSLLRPSSTIKGFGTALQNMHIGDVWRVYIPNQLAYSSSSSSSIPAYSTLIFEIELISYYRRGAKVEPWN